MNMHTALNRLMVFVAAFVFVLLTSADIVHAKDAVRTQITDAGGGIVTENGAFQTPGTYAIGTIKVDYLVVGEQFPHDEDFITLTMCLDTLAGKSRPATNYPATVFVHQVGTPNVSLNVNPSSLLFSGTGDEHCVEVKVSVPASVALDPEYQQDGTTLVANLQLSTPPRSHLDTVTTVKIHLTLVHPSATAACVVPLHFVADNGFNNSLSDNGINLSAHVNNGLNTNHQGHHTVALVNTCATDQHIDLNTALDTNFGLQSAAAVQTTTVNQEFVDIAELLSSPLPPPANQGVQMCLSNILIPANQSFVLKQHISMNSDAKFPGTGCNPGTDCADNQTLGSWSYDGFSYWAHTTGGLNCADLGLSVDVDPNQGTTTIPINQVSYTGPSAPATEYAP